MSTLHDTEVSFFSFFFESSDKPLITLTDVIMSLHKKSDITRKMPFSRFLHKFITNSFYFDVENQHDANSKNDR